MPNANHVKKAIEECDCKGLEDFLKFYGFGRERRYTLVYPEGKLREYPSKAIWGVAHRYDPEYKRALGSGDFSGGVNHGCGAYGLLKTGFKIMDNWTGNLLKPEIIG